MLYIEKIFEYKFKSEVFILYSYPIISESVSVYSYPIISESVSVFELKYGKKYYPNPIHYITYLATYAMQTTFVCKLWKLQSGPSDQDSRGRRRSGRRDL